MGFAHASYLWLLALLPFVGGLLYMGYLRRKHASIAFSTPELMRGNKKMKASGKAEFAYSAAWLLALTLLIVGVAGPYQNDKPMRVPEGSVQACIVFDVSKSMAAEDYRDSMPADAGPKPDLNEPWGSRLQMAKYQINKIMDAIQGNQICLVTYTEKGFPQAEVTNGFTAVRYVLKHWVKIGWAPGDGSNFSAGIAEALEAFKRSASQGKQKVVILMTDGGYTGNLEELAKVIEEMNKEGVRLVIVGIGLPGDNEIPIYENGKRTGVMQKDGKVVYTSYEETGLRSLAAATKSSYFHIDKKAESQVVNIDWMKEIGGYRIEYQKRMLDVYFAGATYALISLLCVVGLWRRRRSSS